MYRFMHSRTNICLSFFIFLYLFYTRLKYLRLDYSLEGGDNAARRLL